MSSYFVTVAPGPSLCIGDGSRHERILTHRSGLRVFQTQTYNFSDLVHKRVCDDVLKAIQHTGS